MTDDELEARQRQAANDRKAKQRHAGKDRANAETIDKELVKQIRKVGESFTAKKKIGRARSPVELPMRYIIEKVASAFPLTERRKVFIRFKLDPAEFLDKNGGLKDWSWKESDASRQGQ